MVEHECLRQPELGQVDIFDIQLLESFDLLKDDSLREWTNIGELKLGRLCEVTLGRGQSLYYTLNRVWLEDCLNLCQILDLTLSSRICLTY